MGGNIIAEYKAHIRGLEGRARAIFRAKFPDERNSCEYYIRDIDIDERGAHIRYESATYYGSEGYLSNGEAYCNIPMSVLEAGDWRKAEAEEELSEAEAKVAALRAKLGR